MSRIALLAAAALVATACGSIDLPPSAALEGLKLTLVATSLEEPAGLASPPGDERLFVIERAGRIRVIDRGRLLVAPAFDLTSEVNALGEKGLTGLAFHPEFQSNQKAYVLYNDTPGDSRLVEYRVGGENRRTFDPSSARLILKLDQEDFFHQGGHVVFGPDGYLWATFGDGGAAADPSGRGQDPHTLHASVIRIDVDSGVPYAIPADNPFADGIDGAPEVWAYGFRNPWRIALDGVNNLLYIADVGQFEWEEVNISPLDEPGKNFGWPILEGQSCFQGPGCEDDPGFARFSAPALIYGRSDGCAVIGGSVYRGAAIPELNGTYFYGDHCNGWIRSVRVEGERILEKTDWSDQLGTVPNLMSFGTDDDGELYLLERSGRVYRLDPIRSAGPSD